MNLRGFHLLAILVAGILGFTSCATGPAPPAPGTPEFYWQAARENYDAGDYVKTNQQLEQITKTDNPYRMRAFAWRLIVLGGLAEGYADLAQQYEYGSQSNKANPTPFRRMTSDYRSIAGRYALQYAESHQEFEKAVGPGEVTLEIPSPKGSPAPVAGLMRVAKGALPAQAETDSMERANVQRHVILSLCRAVGAPEDAAKMQEIVKVSPAQIPNATFKLALAEQLYEIGELFGPRRMDMPDRQKYFVTHAGGAAKDLPESDRLKELQKKLKEAEKKLSARK